MENNAEILFGGYGPQPPKTPEFTRLEDCPRWFEVLEEAFFRLTSSDEGKRLYGDPQKGATIEQAWRTSGIISGKWPVCLLSTEKPGVATGEIRPVIKMSSNELAEVLVEMSGMSETAAFQILYHDGYVGHSITLTGYDCEAARFIYHDPWPGDSLLCRDFNAAGIDAQRMGNYWSISVPELEKIIFAAFVYRSYWSEYLGEKYYTTYDELHGSDFWSFFHLSEVETQQLEAGGTLVRLQTGGFQSEIALSVILNQKNRLAEGFLGLRRSWIIGPPYGLNPFALDITRSFISAMTPPPDQKAAAGFILMFQQIEERACAEQMISEGLDTSFLHKALFAYLGPLAFLEVPFEYSTMKMSNVKHGDAEWLEISITTDTL